jgi:hypothetical protein
MSSRSNGERWGMAPTDGPGRSAAERREEATIAAMTWAGPGRKREGEKGRRASGSAGGSWANRPKIKEGRERKPSGTMGLNEPAG